MINNTILHIIFSIALFSLRNLGSISEDNFIGISTFLFLSYCLTSLRVLSVGWKCFWGHKFVITKDAGFIGQDTFMEEEISYCAKCRRIEYFKTTINGRTEFEKPVVDLKLL